MTGTNDRQPQPAPARDTAAGNALGIAGLPTRYATPDGYEIDRGGVWALKPFGVRTRQINKRGGGGGSKGLRYEQPEPTERTRDERLHRPHRRPPPARRDHSMTTGIIPDGSHLRTALDLAAAGVPPLPLRAGKVPFGNCRACANGACGGRPNMKSAGPCQCPAPCHAWAAATIDPDVLTSPAWAPAWRQAAAVAYHPGGGGLTVVDLDNAAALTWARATLPATRTVATTRGEHWIYRGAMQSANAVRPGVDIKSLMSYARWRGRGTGTMTDLPGVVRALVLNKPSTVRPAGPAVTMPALAGGGHCCHRTPAFLGRGIAMAEQRITQATSAVHTTVYRTFLAVLSAHGRCGCLTDAHITRLFTAAQAKGESLRHCTDAWANARTRLGL